MLGFYPRAFIWDFSLLGSELWLGSERLREMTFWAANQQSEGDSDVQPLQPYCSFVLMIDEAEACRELGHAGQDLPEAPGLRKVSK